MAFHVMVTKLVKPKGKRLATCNRKVFEPPNPTLTLQLRTIFAIIH
jgi:hypothetical protein